MYNFIRPFIVLIIGVSTVCSQDSTNFFPYGDGDFIQYQYYDGYDYEILQATTILDSTDSAGNVYITRDFWFLNPLRKESPFDTERYKIDTLNHIYRIWEGLVVSVNLYYDLNADTNEIWINADIGSGSYEFALIREEYPDTLFNVPTTVKEIDFFLGDTSWDDVCCGLYTERLAAGFGLIYRGGAPLN